MNIFQDYAAQQSKSSPVNNFFTPSTPITTPEHLKGRDVEVRSILDNLTVPGRHCMIYGDRGIGKSSLANATVNGGKEYNIIKGEIFSVSCDSDTKFKDLVAKCAVYVNMHPDKYKEERTIKAGIGVKFLNFFSADLSQDEKIIIEKEEITPRKAADVLSMIQGLLFIDEFDVVDEFTKRAVAEFIKHLSDSGSKLKVLLVGISKDGQSLTAGHESVNRCLHEVRLGAVANNHLEEIIKLGEEGLNIIFKSGVKDNIVDISNGFPYFTHLLCKEAAEIALQEDRSEVDDILFHRSIEKSVQNAEGRLIREYEIASRSSITNVYKEILLSASKFRNREFKVQEWIRQIEDDTGKRYNNQHMSNYTGRLTKPERGAIIKKVGRGVYKITDPRMPSFIRLANM
ncbi:MAG: ATP-binding protein [Pantoea sp.]|uniref:nSTAND1 domain-containing NTPase n=1 Tax=Pantoea sp. TaxID=69393 RepID=UPI0023975417|nr:ATP-binding protein [Pantoea sp.]MDE1190134.1 ATP-binding protein [Pantoea sp.]